MVDIQGATLKGFQQYLAERAVSSTGVIKPVALNGAGSAVVAASTWFLNVKDFGALGDNSANDTTAVNAAKAVLRAAGGGTLYFPEGTYLLDSFHWDWIAGGVGKFVLRGEGSATIIKKRVDDDATFLTIGRNDTTQTFQGILSIEDIDIHGINGGGERVLDLWSLTLACLTNVRARYGAKALSLNNCVTCLGVNVCGSDSVTGLYVRKHVFGDTTYSDPNLNTFIAGAFKDNSGFGVDFDDGKQISFVGTQIENNGTIADNTTGGMIIRSNAGNVSASRRGQALTANGVWFEANKGRAALVLEGGASSLNGCIFVANSDATRDIYSNGGKYTLLECSIPVGRVGGAIEDTANAATGNLIIGGEIASAAAGINEAKTSLIDCQTGTGGAATRVTRYKGRAPVQAPSTSELVIQTGTDSQASGSTVTFPVAFASTPKIYLTVASNAPGRIKNAKYYSPSSSGFTIEKTEVISGSSTVSTTSDTVDWLAIGPMS